MSPVRGRFALSLLCVASACAGDFEVATREACHHDRAVELPPELPKLTSVGLVDHLPHASLEAAPGAYFQQLGSRRITQRVLLLGAERDDSAFLAAEDALERIGIPYDTVIASEEEITPQLLSDGVSTCHFSGVIFSSSGLGYSDANGNWVSAMSAQEWAIIADFETRCSAREAIWYAWPSSELGLTYVSSFPWTDTVEGVLADPSFFTRIPAQARIPYRHASGYRAAVVDPTVTRSLVEDANGNTLMAVHTTPDGREVLVSTVDHSPYAAHSLALEYDMLRWLTRGLFVGEKRAYIAPQVDDIFLENEMWVAGQGHQESVHFRITGTDIDAFLVWQSAFQARLPAGSFYTTHMAFNGFGTLKNEYPDTTLTTAIKRAGSQLHWLNHTWDHENMNALTRLQAKEEVEMNCDRARGLQLHGFTCASLVTPEVSGLLNPQAIRGMLEAGVEYVVSDTSITEAIRPANPGTNPSFNVGRPSPIEARLYQVPRHPTSVYYDVATPENETDEYNAIYRSYYGRDLTYAEVTDKSTEYGLFYLLKGDINPLMFHQANMADYGGGRSLLGDWLDVVADKFLALSNAPIVTLPQEQIGVAMKERAKLDACGATVTIVEAGASRSLELRTTAECTVPITGLQAGGFGEVSLYAGEVATAITMPAGGGVRTIPLQ